MVTKELLGTRIKELRKNRKLSQDQLSEKVGMDPKHLSRIEVGKSYPSIKTLEKIAQELDVEIKDLFEYMHHMKKKELIETLQKLISEADEENLRLIFRVVKAITG